MTRRRLRCILGRHRPRHRVLDHPLGDVWQCDCGKRIAQRHYVARTEELPPVIVGNLALDDIAEGEPLRWDEERGVWVRLKRRA